MSALVHLISDDEAGESVEHEGEKGSVHPVRMQGAQYRPGCDEGKKTATPTHDEHGGRRKEKAMSGR